MIENFQGLPAPTASGLDKSVALDVTGPDEDVVDTLGSPRYDICGPHGENVEFPPRWGVLDEDFSCKKLEGVLLTGVTTSKGEEVFEAIVVVAVLAGGGVQSPATEAAAASWNG